MTYISKSIKLPPRETFPGAEKDVWTATGKRLTEAAVPVKVDRMAAIRAGIQKSGLSQREVAEMLGLSQGTVSLWVSGKRKCPKNRYEELKALFADGPEKIMPEAEKPGKTANKALPEQVKKPDARMLELVRQAGKIARQEIQPDWTDSKELYFLKGIQAMEEAILSTGA